MLKLVALSDNEALLITSALSHWAYHCSSQLPDADKHTSDFLLEDLDICDHLRIKLSRTFDLSKCSRLERK